MKFDFFEISCFAQLLLLSPNRTFMLWHKSTKFYMPLAALCAIASKFWLIHCRHLMSIGDGELFVLFWVSFYHFSHTSYLHQYSTNRLHFCFGRLVYMSTHHITKEYLDFIDCIARYIHLKTCDFHGFSHFCMPRAASNFLPFHFWSSSYVPILLDTHLELYFHSKIKW